MLLVLGPDRLPEVLRTLGLWLGRARRSFVALKTEVEKEIGMDDIRRQLHNEAVMDEMKNLENDVRSFGDEVRHETDMGLASAESESDDQPAQTNESASMEENQEDNQEANTIDPPDNTQQKQLDL